MMKVGDTHGLNDPQILNIPSVEPGSPLLNFMRRWSMEGQSLGDFGHVLEHGFKLEIGVAHVCTRSHTIHA